MNAWSIPPLMLAAVNVYVAVHSVVIFLRTRRSRELLTFSQLALLVAVYDICCAFLYDAPSPEQGRLWQLAQFGTLTAGALALFLFVAESTGQRAGRLFTVLTSAYALVWLTVVVLGPQELVSTVPAVKHAALPFGLDVTYQEAQLGPLAPLLDLLGLAVFAYACWAAVRQRRAGQRRPAARLLAAIVVLLAAALNDAAIGMGLFRSVYLIEYAFLAMVVLMADALSSELVEAGRAQEALARSEQRFRSMVQQSYDLITVIDARGKITYATPSSERVVGRSPGELVGLDAFDIVHPDDVPHVREAFERTAAGRGTGLAIEFRVRHANGTWVHLEGIGTSQLEHPEIRGVVLNSRDVSDRKRAEEAIHRTLRELKVLNAVSQAAVAAEDEATLIENATEIVRVALYPDDCGVLMLDAATRTLHYTPCYRVASSAEDRAPIPLGIGITGTVAATGRAIRVDDVARDTRYLARLPGMGSELCVPLILGGRAIGVLNAESRAVGAFTEGDERVLTTVAGQLATAIGQLRAAAAHRESEERFRRLAESAFEGIGIHEEGRIVDANLRLAEMLGYEPNELIGRHVMEFVAPESAVEVAGFMRVGRNDVYEHLALHRDGTRFPVETQGKPLSEADTTLRVAAVRDITERKQAEERIQRLLERLEHSNTELARAYDTTLEGWSRALELRDRETQGHSARVVDLTLRVARTMGFDEEALGTIRRGALLHDIGKMGIPDSILLKSGPLSAQEWETMRRHPQLARELLDPIDYLRPALDIPYCHHERWDGSGYPRGLKGEDIPIAARIFAVVDAWDGLSHPRPYRDAWPPQRVRAYLREHAGSQFDPQVVDVFLGLDLG